MSHEADYYQGRGASVFQGVGTTVTWNWEMADLDRFMTYAVTPIHANSAVTVRRTTVRHHNSGQITAQLVVAVDPFDRGGDGVCHLTFHAVRVPSL